jgi:hypothetical protein
VAGEREASEATGIVEQGDDAAKLVGGRHLGSLGEVDVSSSR